MNCPQWANPWGQKAGQESPGQARAEGQGKTGSLSVCDGNVLESDGGDG